MRDLYEILGVPRDADADAIKRAYRAKARELHPDAGGDEEAFKELSAAHEILSNEQARANYDRFGDPRGPGGGEGFDGFAGFGDLQDFIESFFGGFGGRRGGGRASAQRGGRDAMVDVRLTLEEAATGVPREVEVTLPRPCSQCEGSGAAPGSAPITCVQCGGAGAVQQVARSMFGNMLTTTTCPRCQGDGQVINDPCTQCGGQGQQEKTETITVDIPAGVADANRLRLTGRGEPGRGGTPPGDLYVRVRIADHPVFTRDGDDLHCELRLPMSQAALGGELKVPTLYGEQPVAVPAGVQSGEVLSIKGSGMPRVGGGAKGRLHIHVRVVTPTDLTEEQEALLRQFAELREEEVREHGGSKGFIGRLRDAFGA